jgi:hypothetical protein
MFCAVVTNRLEAQLQEVTVESEKDRARGQTSLSKAKRAMRMLSELQETANE